MSTNYSNVTLSFTLNADNLFDGTESAIVDTIDISASADRYAELIVSRMQDAFPGINVEYAINHNVTGYAGAPSVHGAEDEDTIIDAYNEIDSAVFAQYDDWAVEKSA